MQVALYTFGILRARDDDPQLKGFFEEIQGNYETANKCKGYITRHDLHESIGTPRFFTPDIGTSAPQTFSIWESVEDAYNFVYQGSHLHSLRQRRDWFVTPKWPGYVLWWVEDGELPPWEEGWHRLEYLHDNGPTHYGFTFKNVFNPTGEPIAGSYR